MSNYYPSVQPSPVYVPHHYPSVRPASSIILSNHCSSLCPAVVHISNHRLSVQPPIIYLSNHHAFAQHHHPFVRPLSPNSLTIIHLSNYHHHQSVCVPTLAWELVHVEKKNKSLFWGHRYNAQNLTSVVSTAVCHIWDHRANGSVRSTSSEYHAATSWVREVPRCKHVCQIPCSVAPILNLTSLDPAAPGCYVRTNARTYYTCGLMLYQGIQHLFVGPFSSVFASPVPKGPRAPLTSHRAGCSVSSAIL